MDSSDVIKLLILLLLIILSSFFSSSETALTTANKFRIKSLMDEGDKRAAILMEILEDSGKMLTAILIGNNIVNLTASSLTTSLAMKWGNYAVGIGTGILTFVVLVFAEISPKTYATIYSEKLALRNAKVIWYMMKIMTPVIYVVNQIAMLVLMLRKVDPEARMEAYTENELRTILEASQEDGVIEEEEHQMINNVFDFGDTMAKDVMIPRIDMTCLDINASYEEVLLIFQEDHHTRMPIYEENTDNVVGILNMKDLLLYNSSEPFDLRDFMRKAYYTYEYKNTSELFLKMRESAVNIIIVLDEYGATAGMITLEDLLEEIVGEIRDEYDEEEENAIRQISEREFVVDGSLKLDDINEELELELESEDYDSIGGYIIELLDRLPLEGESVTDEQGLRLIVETLDKKRIETVRLILPEKPAEDIA